VGIYRSRTQEIPENDGGFFNLQASTKVCLSLTSALGVVKGKTVSKRIAHLTLVAAMAACSISGVCQVWAVEQVEVNPPPERVLDLVVGVSRLVSTAAPFSAVDIADPNVVDAKPETDKTVLLVPKASGETTIYFFDEKKIVLSSFIVRIAPSASPELQPGSIRPNYMQVPGRVKLHNFESLSGVTYYQCSENNCELVQVAPLQAPPATETKQTSTTKEIPGGTTQTTTTTTMPH
jgi:Pilus formation protein N terminal region